MIGAVLVSALLRRVERVQAEVLGQHYARTVRRRLYMGLLRSDPRQFKKSRKGAVLLKFVGDLSALRRWISLGLSRLLVGGVAVFIALAALLCVHWPFAVGVAAILSLSGAWILWQSTAVRSAISGARRCQANLAGNITEKLNNLVTVQAFGQIDRERRLMRRLSNRLLQASARKATKIGTLRATIDATAGASVAAVLALAFFAPPADLSAGMVAAVISIIGFLTPPLRDLERAQEYWLAAQVARNHLLTISSGAKRLRSRQKGEPLVVERGDIRFENVSVRGALTHVTVEAAGGSRIAVIGGNGSGKSTLLGLAGRLFDPDKGRIMIDGQHLARVQLSSVRRQIAYVSAEVPLMRGSLQRNLCYGAEQVEPERLQQVVVDCGLVDLVERLPGGYQARIAEGGSSLSQGERVRVSLARALLRQPDILLLDEADANLDARAIRFLDANIQRFPGTVLMATHRDSALSLCDVQWSLQNGRLVAGRNVAKSAQPGTEVDALRQTSGKLRVAISG